jgi:hypothetical protein
MKSKCFFFINNKKYAIFFGKNHSVNNSRKKVIKNILDENFKKAKLLDENSDHMKTTKRKF